MNIELSALSPFNLRSVIRSHGWRQLVPFTEDAEAGSLRYIDELPSGRVAAYRIRETPNGVSVEVSGPVHPDERAEIERRLTWMLGLDQDLSAFYSLAKEEPKLAASVGRAAERRWGRLR